MTTESTEALQESFSYMIKPGNLAVVVPLRDAMGGEWVLSGTNGKQSFSGRI